MTERPIIFTGPMVRAILEGRKTQTRRVVAQQPADGWTFDVPPQFGRITSPHPKKCRFGAFIRYGVGTDFPSLDLIPCPDGMPGDRLWVRETTCDVELNGYVGPVFVESDEGAHAATWGWGESDDPDYIEPYELRKRRATHMPRSMARIMLEITGVRAERLQDISEVDAIDEGALTLDEGWLRQQFPANLAAREAKPPGEKPTLGPSPRMRFAKLWDSLNASRGYGWEANPWVWAIEFTKVG